LARRRQIKTNQNSGSGARIRRYLQNWHGFGRMDTTIEFLILNRSIYALESRSNRSLKCVDGKSKQIGIPERGHKSIDISTTAQDTAEWTIPLDSSCRIGLSTPFNSILIVVLGLLSANQNNRQFQKRDSNPSISLQPMKPLQNGRYHSIPHAK